MEEEKNTQNEINGLSGFSKKEFKFAYWYVNHKKILRKILVVFLIIFSFAFGSYGLYGFINYFFIESPFYDQMVKNISRPLIDYQSLKDQPQGLSIGNVEIFSLGSMRYDMAVKIVNPNERWSAIFNYRFTSTEESGWKKGFILPHEEKYLSELGFTSKNSLSSVGLELKDLKWQRLSAHQIPDYPSYYKSRINFKIDEIKFIQDDKVNRVFFKALNQTAYSYWQAGFYVLLWRSDKLFGLNYLSLDQFISGQTRNAEISFFERLPSASEVQIIPEINILDPGVYMKL